MKGICIDDTELVRPVLEYGKEYILEPPTKKYEVDAYYLPEIGYNFNANRFVPLSNKDETEYSEKIMEQIFVPVKNNQL